MTENVIAARVWFRFDADLHDNPKVAGLTDAQFRAWVMTLCAAKRAQSEGEWPTEAHYRQAVGPRFAKHIGALLAAGLLERSEGWISVHDWRDYQPKDPTAVARQRRHREKVRASRVTSRKQTDRQTEQTVTTVTDAGALNGAAPVRLRDLLPNLNPAIFQGRDDAPKPH